ncbi:MAG: hypothetical protein HFE73_00390 [Firmicutes bacterium]|nr:hypothetical protein [Bacillota bacterium]
MKVFGEMIDDMDFTRPRVVVSDHLVILENVAGIVMLSETSITVRHGLKVKQMKVSWHTTIIGSDFVIKEIYEGRLLIEGKIQRVEFLQSSATGQG